MSPQLEDERRRGELFLCEKVRYQKTTNDCNINLLRKTRRTREREIQCDLMKQCCLGICPDRHVSHNLHVASMFNRTLPYLQLWFKVGTHTLTYTDMRRTYLHTHIQNCMFGCTCNANMHIRYDVVSPMHHIAVQYNTLHTRQSMVWHNTTTDTHTHKHSQRPIINMKVV